MVGRTYILFFNDGIYKGICYSLIDFFGLSCLFGTPTLNGTWWYMSAAVVFILIIPAIYKCKNDIPLLLMGIIVFLRIIRKSGESNIYPGNVTPYPFLAALVMGTVFARYNLFDKWRRLGSGKSWQRLYKLAVLIWFTTFGYIVYHELPIEPFWEYHYGFFPVLIILLAEEYILRIRYLRSLFIFLGKHSMNIFMVHTFIRYYYFKDFIYSFKNHALIVLVLLGISLLLLIIINTVKRVIGYNHMTERALKWFESC